MVLAIDIGGTKLAAARVTQDGEILERAAVATPRSAVAHEIVAALAGLLERFETLGAEACGVGTAGPLQDHGALVSPLNIPAWRGFPLRSWVADTTGLTTYVDGDAKALALAEGWRGAARGRGHYLSMVVSTGVGGGIVLDGRLLDGATGNAGHIGHITVEPDGRPCVCGAVGCLEAEVSGTAIAAATGRPPAEADLTLIERSGRLTGRAIATVANLLDVPVAYVAGSVALGYGAPFFAAAQAELSVRARMAYARHATVAPSGLGADGPLLGAAAVAWTGLGLDVLAAHPWIGAAPPAAEPRVGPPPTRGSGHPA